jgi:Fe-S-cluster containining protein
MNCRPNCGACCIALSISSPIPGLPKGKPAGMRCIHLTDNLQCAIYTSPDKPKACAGLKPSEEMCGNSAEDAYAYLMMLEKATAPDKTAE